MRATMTYSDGEHIELGDNVTFYRDGFEMDGQVAAIYPGKRDVKVRYRNYTATNRDGSGKLAVARLPISDVELLRREG